MRNHLSQFMTATDINVKWQICQQYQGHVWSLGKTGINASCESDGGRFWITNMNLEGYGIIQVASEEIPTSNAFGITTIRVEPPRTFEDLQDCGCPLYSLLKPAVNIRLIIGSLEICWLKNYG